MPDQAQVDALAELEAAAVAHDEAAEAWPQVRVVTGGEQVLEVNLVDVIGAGTNPLTMGDDQLVTAVRAYLREARPDVTLPAKPTVYRVEEGNIVVGPEAGLGAKHRLRR
jgi:hypothetical protein